MRNPPPIQISGQRTTSEYQLTLQSVNLDEIYQWTPVLVDKMRQLPGFVDVNSDMQIASPQVTLDIDRDRALALGVTPQQIQNALCVVIRQPRGFNDLRAGKPVFGHPGNEGGISAQPGSVVEAVSCVRRKEH